MAKAKRSRRARRQRTVKQQQQVTSPAPQDKVESGVEESQPPEVVEDASTPRNVVNFAREYFYVYTELRNILIVAIVMFIVMAGLAYFV